ncbi:conserved exported hypothetical protein [Candidatus Desulfarcum epimagneticum]|uniref:Uncharacterized protein n=1 Tax=uncultured Desulfobacteraceae bacterium TaxID=218296 RepID=A0A484HGE5_9BACT|nr:conserved exported hypothetical protein [uncultured Desulfobacteraceae bacterium]
MKKIHFLCLIFFILAPSISFAQTDYSKELHERILDEVDGRYKAEDAILLETDAKSIQLKISAEAPIGVIGRDNFVSLYSTYSLILIMSMMEGSGISISDMKFRDLDGIIGFPDIEIAMVFAKSGMQIIVKSDQGVNRFTETWDKIFNKK